MIWLMIYCENSSSNFCKIPVRVGHRSICQGLLIIIMVAALYVTMQVSRRTLASDHRAQLSAAMTNLETGNPRN